MAAFLLLVDVQRQRAVLVLLDALDVGTACELVVLFHDLDHVVYQLGHAHPSPDLEGVGLYLAVAGRHGDALPVEAA